MARNSTFTTYFNSVVDTTGGAKLDALASQATSAYDKIASAAQRAAQASGLVGGSGTGGLGVSSSLDKQAASARALGLASSAAGTSTDRFATAAAAAGRASAVAAVENEALNASLKSTATALAVIQGPLGPLAGRVRALSGAFKEFSFSGIGLLAAAGAVAGIAAIGNEYQQLQTKLRPFFESQQATNVALNQVAGIAQSARASLEPIADLYVRLTTLQKELGAGTNVASLATTIAKSSTLSGGSADNQAEGIRQLTQGLGRGILNGQDLRALEEDSFNLAKTIADGLGVNVGQLKQLGAEGKLTTDVVVAALTREAEQVNYQFSLLPVTLSSAGREFKNAFEIFIGGVDQSTGLTNSLAESLQSVSTHIGAIITAGAALGAAFAAPKAVSALTDVISFQIDKLTQRNALLNGTTYGPIAPDTASGRADANRAAVNAAQADADAASAARRLEDAKANAAFAQQDLDEAAAQVTAIQSVQTAEQEAAAAAVAGAEQRLAAVKAAAAEEAQARLAAAQVDIEASQSEVAAAKAAVAEATAVRNAAQQRVISAQNAGQAALDDPSLTRASSARIAAQAAQAEQLATAELTNADEALAAAVADVTTAEASLADARRVGRAAALSPQEIQAIAAAEEELAVALTQENAAAEALGVSMADLRTARLSVIEATVALGAATAVVAEEEEALTVATVEQAAAQTTLATVLASARAAGATFGAVLGDILGAFNPLTLIIGAAAAALVVFATNTDAATTSAQNFAGSQAAVQAALGRTIDKIESANGAAHNFAINQAQIAQASSRSDALSAAQAAGADLSSAANRFSGFAGSTKINADANALQSGKFDIAQIISDVTAAAAKNPGVFSQGTGGILDKGTPGTPGYQAGQLTGIADALVNLGHANSALAKLNTTAASTAPILDKTSKTFAQIEVDAAARADGGTAVVREDAVNKQNVQAIKQRFGVGADGSTKTLSGQQEKDAEDALAAEDTRHRNALANIQSEKTAAHDAAVAAKNDALGNAENERLEALIALEKNRGNLSVAQYNAQKEAIDATYDTEKSRIEANGSLSHTSLTQQLADLTKLNEAFAKQGQAITSFSGKYVDQPKPQAQYDAAIGKLRENENVVDASGASAYAQTEAAIAASVSPLNKALNDYYRTLQENGVVGKLAADGLTAQSDALKEALDLQRTQGDVTDAQVARLVEENLAQEKINETLAARQTITNNILGLVDSTKSALTNFFETLSAGPGKAIGTLATTLETNLKNVLAENLATSLTSGATGAVKTLFQSNAPADVAQRAFAKTIDSTNASFAAEASTYSASVDKVTSTTDRLNGALDSLATHATAAAGSASGASGTGLAGLSNSATDISALLAPPAQLDTTTSGNALTKSLLGSQQADGFFPEADSSSDNAIVVTATKAATAAAKTGAAATSPIEALNAIGGSVAGKIDSGLKTLLAPLGSVGDTLDKGLSAVTNTVGKNLGTALQGAGIGATTGSLIFGNNQSSAGKVGDQVGGAIGSVVGKALSGTISKGLSSVVSSGLSSTLGSLAGPLGGVLGSLAGGLLGGLFAKKIQGGATITADSYGNLSSTTTAASNDSKATAAATSEATTISQGIEQIAQTLGAQITGSPNITVGTYKGNYRVNTEGTKLGGSSSPVPGLTDFGDDENAAVQYAIVASIQNGVIKGISQASINILKSGQDLTTALNKALTIENIPKQLEALTNPVKSAVDTLNDQFQTVISDLNEGGATAEQYTQAQELYDKERASAIASAAKSVFGTVEDYITSLTDGTSSVLNKPTTLANAKSTFDALAKQIDAGQTVDQDALVSAAKNYQAASTASNGSDTSFFSDYNYILAELKKADAAATAGVDTSATQTDLPASPFTTDATAAAAIASASSDQVAATNSSTAQIVAALQANTAAVQALSTSTVSGTTSSVLSRLTGVANK